MTGLRIHGSGKVSPRKLGHRERVELTDELLTTLRAIMRLKNPSLLLNLLTASEHIMLARRIQTAKRLLAGNTFVEIRSDLGVGQATVEVVERLLKEHFPEYRATLPDLYKELRQKARKAKPIEPYSFRWLRRKYPLHFLLFNLLLDDIEWERNKKLPRSMPPHR